MNTNVTFQNKNPLINPFGQIITIKLPSYKGLNNTKENEIYCSQNNEQILHVDHRIFKTKKNYSINAHNSLREQYY